MPVGYSTINLAIFGLKAINFNNERVVLTYKNSADSLKAYGMLAKELKERENRAKENQVI